MTVWPTLSLAAISMCLVAVLRRGLLSTFVTLKNESPTGEVLAVHVTTRRALTRLTDAQGKGVLRKRHSLTLVKNKKSALPQTGVPLGFTVSDDSSIDLVDLGKSAVLHYGGKNLASNTPGAIGHNGATLEIVVLAAFNFGDEVMGGFDVGDDRISESPNLRLERIATIKEDDFVPAGCHERIDFIGREMHAAIDHAVTIHFDFMRHPKGDQFVAHFDAQPWKVLPRTFRPLEIHVMKGFVSLGCFDVLLDFSKTAADGPINAVRRHDNSPS